MRSQIFYCVFIIALHTAYCDVFLHTTLAVLQPGATLMNYIYFNTNNAVVTKCAVTYVDPDNNQTVAVALELDKNYKRQMTQQKVETVKSRISPLLRGICGLKLVKYSINDPKMFTLMVEYREFGQSNTANRTFQASTYNLITVNDQKYVVELGQQLNFDCGVGNKGKHCVLYDPSGNIVLRSTACKYSIKHINVKDIGTWKCQSALMQNMEPHIEHVTVELFDGWRMETWYKEEKGYGIIGCHYVNNYENVVNPVRPLTYCQMIRPDGSIFTVSTDVGATARYTSVGTNLTDYTCQLEFPLPIKTNEMGSWQCLIDNSGGFVIAKNSSVNELIYEKHKNLVVPLEAPFQIQCQVPYSTEDCYIVSPSGDIYSGGTSAEFSIGNCSTWINKANYTHIGQWVCHISKPDQVQDDIVTVDVTQYKGIMAVERQIDADDGDQVELHCKAEAAISNCAFQDPHGTTYHVSPRKQSTGMWYIGKGFNYGECGLLIDRIGKADEGKWKCLVRLNVPDLKMSSDTLIAYVDINVYKSGLSTGSALGIGIGSLSVGAFVIVVVLYRWYRKKQVMNNNIHSDEFGNDTPLNAVHRQIEINDDVSPIAHI